MMDMDPGMDRPPMPEDRGDMRGDMGPGPGMGGPPSRGGPAPPSTKVYVGNLRETIQRRDIEELFGNGQIVNVEMKPHGFCFVEFGDIRDAEDAVARLKGYVIDGQEIRVEFARGRRFPDGPRGGGGGGETCFVCQETGHWARDCPRSANPGIDVRSGKCFKCGQPGHLAKYCRDSGDPYRGGRDGYGRPPSPQYGRGRDDGYYRDRSPPRYDRRPSPPRYSGGGGYRDRSPPRGMSGDRGYGPPPDRYGNGGYRDDYGPPRGAPPREYRSERPRSRSPIGMRPARSPPRRMSPPPVARSPARQYTRSPSPPVRRRSPPAYSSPPRDRMPPRPY
ncbi:hypothetical protein DFJ74DRAFT_502619 [Hyaloraphidium curvatum]|nr:hypothetical protein DFJ74DRAFT_502619 [Hyaloraphidium curvatum]